MVLQQVGSYLGYTGRGANPFGKAARDPLPTPNLPLLKDSVGLRKNFGGHRHAQSSGGLKVDYKLVR